MTWTSIFGVPASPGGSFSSGVSGPNGADRSTTSIAPEKSWLANSPRILFVSSMAFVPSCRNLLITPSLASDCIRLRRDFDEHHR
jgi:hypothetical protein